MKKPLFSVVYLNYNRKHDLFDSLNELKKQSFSNYEIIIVDNNSKDGSQEAIKKKFPHVKLIEMNYNTGVPLGRNIGIKNSKGKYIVFIDNDAVLEYNVLEKVKEIFDREKNIAIIGFKILNYYTNKLDFSSWVYSNYMLKNKNKRFLANTFCGCGCAIRKSIIKKIGLYDPIFFFTNEEDDLSIRILNQGYKILYEPNILVYHKLSNEKRNKKRMYYFIRNRLWFIWKNFSLYTSVKISIFYIIFYFFKSLRNKNFNFYLKGIIHSIKNMKDIKRNPVNNNIAKFFFKNKFKLSNLL